MITLQFIILFGIGFLLGYQQHRIKEITKKMSEPPAENPTVTLGAYNPAKEYGADRDDSAIVEPKTPQRLQWESEQNIEKEGALGGRNL